MQIASILSDLTSLRACNHNEALALVHASSSSQPSSSTTSAPPPPSSPPTKVPETTTINPQKDTDTDTDADPDLQRALDLVDLHYSVKVKLVQGPDVGLQRARADVEGVLRRFRGK
ncbi:hypothetical protein MMC16_000432 [Acarospora aff. strigata]|nr:hypothetical protein [Acarospora aff. strigata]